MPQSCNPGLTGSWYTPNIYRRTSNRLQSCRQDGSHPPRVPLIDARTLRKYPSSRSPNPLIPRILIPAHSQPPEPPRPHILPLRLARARSSDPVRHLRDPDMVDARSGDTPDVCRADGVRGVQLLAEKIDQGGEAET